jgi:hypothetical protein
MTGMVGVKIPKFKFFGGFSQEETLSNHGGTVT